MIGEHVTVPERMIVAPAVGVFRPRVVAEGSPINQGDIVGVVEGPSTEAVVRSPFTGTLMGMLAHAGERLREGQPVAWMRVA
jgi:biotin carboxyl carrier protein